MPTQPTGVVPSDASVQLFGRIIQEAYAGMAQKLTTADLSTPSRRTQVMREIKEYVNETDKTVQSWVKVNVGGFYEMGLWESAKDLHNRGTPVAYDPSFTHFHREALSAIAQETYNDISTGMQGITRTSERIISQATTQNIINKIGRGQITGESNRDITRMIKETLKNTGVIALRDKSGREWDLDRYGEMLVRTKLTQAHNTGVANRMVESGNDLVIVSNHMGSCKICAPWEGKILSLTGRNPKYISLDFAKDTGLFHPNCRHVITPYFDKYLDASVGWNADQGRYQDFNKLRLGIIAKNKKIIEQAVKKIPIEKASELITKNVSGSVVSFAGKQMELTPFESDLAKRRDLKISDTPVQGKKKNSVYGLYDTDKNEIQYGTQLQKRGNAEATFRHEYGHFIDAKYKDYSYKEWTSYLGGVARTQKNKVINYLSKEEAFAKTIENGNGRTVIIERLKREDPTLSKLSNKEIETLMAGGRVPSGEDGKAYVLPASYRKYLRTYSEIFAEAYSQFRTNPEMVKKTMPEVYQYFTNLSKVQL